MHSPREQELNRRLELQDRVVNREPVEPRTEYHDVVLDYGHCEYIQKLLESTVRHPNQCISKGQLKTVCEQVMARNHLLERAILELRIENRKLKGETDGTSETE